MVGVRLSLLIEVRSLFPTQTGTHNSVLLVETGCISMRPSYIYIMKKLLITILLQYASVSGAQIISDTFSIVMLACDTTTYSSGISASGVMNSGYHVSGSSQAVFWTRGHVIRECHSEDDGISGWYMNHTLPPRSYWLPTEKYLDEYRIPFPKGVYVWKTNCKDRYWL